MVQSRASRRIRLAAHTTREYTIWIPDPEMYWLLTFPTRFLRSDCDSVCVYSAYANRIGACLVQSSKDIWRFYLKRWFIYVAMYDAQRCCPSQTYCVHFLQWVTPDWHQKICMVIFLMGGYLARFNCFVYKTTVWTKPSLKIERA